MMDVPFGPWSPDISADERARQLRCLAGLVACYFHGPHPLIGLLRKAENDDFSLDQARKLLNRMPAPTVRRILSTFSEVTYGHLFKP